VGDDFLARAVANDATFVEQYRAVAELRNGLQLMRDEHHRAAGRADVFHPAETAGLELGVTDAQHLVHEHDLRLEVRGHREREAHVHAARVTLDRRVEELLRPENSAISGSFAWISFRLMPRIAPFRYTFSRPVSSGWKPVPTSSKLPTRPRISARPCVGVVIRVSTLRSVDFPAPFRPMTPSAWPSSRLNETSLSAQISS